MSPHLSEVFTICEHFGQEMDALRTLDRELGGPGAARLYAAARRRGVEVSREQVAAFARTRSEIEPVARAQPFRGQSAAEAPNARWQLDTAIMRPAQGKVGFLVATDVFTRKSWTTPLRSKEAGPTSQAVEKLFEKAGAKPQILTSDDGGEFNGLHRLAEEEGIVYKRKLKDDVNAIAVTDRAMGEIKLNLKKRSLQGQGQWPQNLAKATEAKNETLNSAVHGAPNDVDKGGVQNFMVLQDNAQKFAENHKQNKLLTERVLTRGWYRPARPLLDKLHRRIATVRYGEPEELHGLRAGMLVNRKGREAMLKQALITGPPGERQAVFRRQPLRLSREAPIATRTRARLRAAATAPVPPAPEPVPPAPPPTPEPPRRPRLRVVM